MKSLKFYLEVKGVSMITFPEPLAGVWIRIEAVGFVVTVHGVARALLPLTVGIALVTHGPVPAIRVLGKVASVKLEIPHHGLTIGGVLADEVIPLHTMSVHVTPPVTSAVEGVSKPSLS